MEAPLISIVLAYHNAGKYIRAAVESILTQTLSDFELIVIDDGSTDESRSIIESIHDKRMVHIINDGNLGLIASLNRGLQASRGKFIARMDADDICLPDRFRIQTDYLESHPSADMVASRVGLIDEEGRDIGEWADEAAHISPESIRGFMPVNNCICHPSIMARRQIIQALGYRSEQKGIEDYDLWLRWLSAGHTIHKTDIVLLKYRMVSSGVTRNRQHNVYLNLAKAKWRFLMYSLKQHYPGSFEMKVLYYCFIDIILSAAKELKRVIKR